MAAITVKQKPPPRDTGEVANIVSRWGRHGRQM